MSLVAVALFVEPLATVAKTFPSDSANPFSVTDGLLPVMVVPFSFSCPEYITEFKLESPPINEACVSALSIRSK